jgi:hypothetical protein
MPNRRASPVWKSIVAGLCGSLAHSSLMYAKSRLGLLPSFQPYEALQMALAEVVGRNVHPIVPWALSFINGSMIVGFFFGKIYRWVPGRSGAAKGLIYGVLGWAVMGLVFYPLLGLGVFAFNVGIGIAPALFSLAMLLTYSVTMGVVFDALKA